MSAGRREYSAGVRLAVVAVASVVFFVMPIVGQSIAPPPDVELGPLPAEAAARVENMASTHGLRMPAGGVYMADLGRLDHPDGGWAVGGIYVRSIDVVVLDVDTADKFQESVEHGVPDSGSRFDGLVIHELTHATQLGDPAFVVPHALLCLLMAAAVIQWVFVSCTRARGRRQTAAVALLLSLCAVPMAFLVYAGPTALMEVHAEYAAGTLAGRWGLFEHYLAQTLALFAGFAALLAGGIALEVFRPPAAAGGGKPAQGYAPAPDEVVQGRWYTPA